MYNHIDRVIKFALQYYKYPPAYPLEIGEIILRLYPEQNLLISAILYSTIDHSSRENISKGLKQIEEDFGHNVADKISNITKFSNYKCIAHDLIQIYKFTNELNLIDKTTNFSILLIKLANLLHGLSVFNNYYNLSQEQVKLISLEILEVYLPLISRIDIDIEDTKTELQEFCTKIVYPAINKDIKEYLGAIKRSEEFLNDIAEDLNQALSSSQIKATVSGRIKSYYSIWRKLHYKNTTIEKLNDIIGFRIIVDNIDDCYSALQLIHQRYQSLPGKFHDFINIPKGNGYQSLHTVIVGPKSQRLEVQIRTTKMHQIAQHGSAAHWKYKHDFAKTLSVLISTQKLYTKSTVNLSIPNTITQHNTSNVNTPIITTNIQHGNSVVPMSSIGLLKTDNNKQKTDNEVVTDKKPYINSLNPEEDDSCITINSLICRLMNLLLKYIQNDVRNQIMDFIVINDVANFINISLKGKAQAFGRDISYANENSNINYNKQNKDTKYVLSPLEKEVIITYGNSYAHSNHTPTLVLQNSGITKNVDIVKETTLTEMQSNSNELNPEQITQEEKQKINSTQNIFNTTLQAGDANISDNATNITTFYESELQDDSTKYIDGDVQYAQLDSLNMTTISETEVDNYRLKPNSRNESNDVLDFENKTPSSNLSCLSNASVNTADHYEHIVDSYIENKSKNSTNMLKEKERIIKMHRSTAKVFCAIIESESLKKQMQSIVGYNVTRIKNVPKYSSNDKGYLISETLYSILNTYESICPQNANYSLSVPKLESTKQNIFNVNKLIKYNLCRGPQIITGSLLMECFTLMLESGPRLTTETHGIINLFIILSKIYYRVYCQRYTNDQNVLYSSYTKAIKIARHDNVDISSNQENKNSQLKLSDNESNTYPNTKIMDYIKEGNLMEVCNILFNSVEWTNDLSLINCNQDYDGALFNNIHQHLKYKPIVKDMLNIKDEDGNTPILIAISKSNFLMVMLLLEFGGSSLNIENQNHNTPLSLAFTSHTINRCIIDILIQTIIIKHMKQLSIRNEKFKEFITSSEEFEQFYNACRYYVKNFSSIMIIDLLVEMNIVSPQLMQNLVVGLYHKSYSKGDDKFQEYLKCIGCVDTDAVDEDCNVMIFNDYLKHHQLTTNCTVEDIDTLNELQQNTEQSLRTYEMIGLLERKNKKSLDTEGINVTSIREELERRGIDLSTKVILKEGVDIKGGLVPFKCQLNACLKLQLERFFEIYKYIVKPTIMMAIGYNFMSDKTDAKQESNSGQYLIKHCKFLDDVLLKKSKKIIVELTGHTQPCECHFEKHIKKDTTNLHMLFTEVKKVYSLSRELLLALRRDDKIEYLREQYEEILKGIQITKELFDDFQSCTTTLSVPSNIKTLPEYSIIEFLRTDPQIEEEDKKSILTEVNEGTKEDVDYIQLPSCVEHGIGLKDVCCNTILGGEQLGLKCIGVTFVF